MHAGERRMCSAREEFAMRRCATCLSIGGFFLSVLGGAHAVEAGTGLSPSADSPGWARWQGRVAITTGAPLWRNEFLRGETAGLKVQSFGVLGDYYFTRSQLGQHGAGGFRATSGMLLGNASSLWATQSAGGIGGGLSVSQRNASLLSGVAGTELASDGGTVPYIGVGYTGLSLKGGWGFAADVGLKAVQSGSTVRFGRVMNGSQNLDELVRDLRLTPALQLGVSYSF
jgi:hypothetical protein